MALGYLLSMTYGLRPGEVLGLKMQDVKLSTKVILIQRDVATQGEGVDLKTMKPIGVKTRVDAVKSKNSLRPIYINDTIVKLLEYHMHILEAEKKKRGGYDEGFLFPTKDGKPTKNRNYGHAFTCIVEGARIKGKAPHHLRHTFRTILGRLRVADIDAICLMGHSPVQTVTDLYNGRTNKELRERFESEVQPYMENTYHKLALEEITKRDPDRVKLYL
jgi:integrase